MQLTKRDMEQRAKLARQTDEYQAMTPGQKAARRALEKLSGPMRQTILLWRKQHKKPAIPGV